MRQKHFSNGLRRKKMETNPIKCHFTCSNNNATSFIVEIK